MGIRVYCGGAASELVSERDRFCVGVLSCAQVLHVSCMAKSAALAPAIGILVVCCRKQQRGDTHEAESTVYTGVHRVHRGGTGMHGQACCSRTSHWHYSCLLPQTTARGYS
jgi:hypothetical protein